jgi:hypothetical protein
MLTVLVVESLLNPLPAPLGVNKVSSSLNGLATLAHAASLCDEDPSKPPSSPSSSHPTENTRLPELTQSEHSERSCCAPQKPPPTPSLVKLPPLLTSVSSLSSAPTAPLTMPEFDRLASLAGTGCTCGFTCACPGCAEHRGADNPTVLARGEANCRDCIDMSLACDPLPSVFTSSCCTPASGTSITRPTPLDDWSRTSSQSSDGKIPSAPTMACGAKDESDVISFLTTESSNQRESFSLSLLCYFFLTRLPMGMM